MVDHVSPDRRSRIMARVGQRDTKPEMILRRALFSLGYRYRLHSRRLPGRPDLVFPARKKVIFVHGCFWHGHGCRWGKLPKTRLDYWEPKIRANIERDRRALSTLAEQGWTSYVVWQCELRQPELVIERVEEFLRGP
ncbi:very short patch repair endonuclease [Sphingopyxis sp. P8]|uniref:very short patch repair endonuclease n=1 Tax=Sphingopyxis sp. P8 TaxID=2763256 RepID=UPI001D0B7774|nr:very short patch repair endonuclease [Sphingopyxis sp. P8]